MSKSVSFQEIEDEELAKKLQKEFDDLDDDNFTNDNLSEKIMTDEEYAMHLSLALNGYTEEEVIITDSHENSEDEHFSEKGDSSQEDDDFIMNESVSDDETQGLNKKDSEILARFPDLKDVKNLSLGNVAYNGLHEISRMNKYNRDIGGKTKTKDHMKSIDKVIDEKTQLLIFKMINKGAIEGLDHIISTGKEAVVYNVHTMHLNILMNPLEELGTSDLMEANVAVKIFKTTIAEFKNRTDYVKGDYRFDRVQKDKMMKNESDEEDEIDDSGHSKKSNNSDRMIEVWSDKEFQNLKKMYQAGISVPKPYYKKRHMVFMELISNSADGAEPALTLHQVWNKLKLKQLNDCYMQIIQGMAKMYQDCKLIHADLSEYNLLYSNVDDNAKIYFIDVSQSVDIGHPRAMEFLKRDCEQIYTFFSKIAGLNNVLSVDRMLDNVMGDF